MRGRFFIHVVLTDIYNSVQTFCEGYIKIGSICVAASQDECSDASSMLEKKFDIEKKVQINAKYVKFI